MTQRAVHVPGQPGSMASMASALKNALLWRQSANGGPREGGQQLVDYALVMKVENTDQQPEGLLLQVIHVSGV